MAKPKTASAWQTIEFGMEQMLVLAPAEVAIAWAGSDPTSKIRVTLTYWQKILRDLPGDLRPKYGHPDTPHHVVNSQAEADALVDRLRQFVLARHPKMKVKKQKNLNLTRFMHDDNVDYWLTVAPETHAELVNEEIGEKVDACTSPVGDARALLWRVKNHWDVRVRATADEILFVDSAAPDDQLVAFVSGKATAHGNWTCEKLLVGMWMWLSITDLRGIEERTVAALASVANKPLRARSSEAVGGAIVVPAEGRFRVETGGGAKLRWCRFARA